MTKKQENNDQNKKRAKSKPASAKSNDFTPPSSEDLRQLSLAMVELSTSLHEFVTYMRENPELPRIPESLRELTKRISVLSTRL